MEFGTSGQRGVNALYLAGEDLSSGLVAVWGRSMEVIPVLDQIMELKHVTLLIAQVGSKQYKSYH